MNDRASLLVMFAALGLGALVLANPGASPIGPSTAPLGGESDKPLAATRAGVDEAVDRVALLLHEFWGLQWAEWQTVRARFAQTGSEVVIVSVPDPSDSHFGPTFDQMVEALQLAATAAGYTLDRFDLPWRSEAAPPAEVTEVETNVSNDGEPVVRATSRHRAPPPLHRQRPGALLFRGDPDRALLLLLVGETPTDGVRRAALQQALRLLAELKPPGDPAAGPQTAHLLAPTFSGSAYSIRSTVESWSSERVPAYDVEFISGGATVENLPRILGDCTRQSDPSGGTPAARWCFRSLSWPRDVTQDRLYEFLERHGATDDNTILFTESGTLYGAAPGARAERKTALRPTVVSYPLHLGHIRSAYSRQGLLADALNPAHNAVSRAALAVPLELKGEPVDVPPLFFPAEASAVGDRAISALLAHLNRERIRFVGILGSDPQDKLFLARRIHEYMPNVQLFTMLGDLHFVHPAWSRDLLGMWVASPYPLVPETQHDSGSRPPDSPQRRIQFQSSAMEGVYNALIAILVESARLRGVPADDLIQQLVDVDDGGPALWITAVGRGEFWPLRREPLAGASASARTFVWQAPSGGRAVVAHRPAVHPIPFGVWLAILTLSVMATGSVLLVANPFVFRSPLVERAGRCFPNLRWVLSPRRAAARGPAAARAFARRLLGMLWLGVIAYAFGYTLLIVAPGLHVLLQQASGPNWAMTVVAVAAIFAALVMLVAAAAIMLIGGRLAPANRAGGLVVLVMVVSVAVLWGVSVLHPDMSALMRYTRAVELGSGLSSIVPTLLLSAAALLALTAKIRRVRLLERAAGLREVAANGRFGALVEHIERALGGDLPRGGSSGWPMATAGILPLVLFLAVLTPRRITSADAYPWLPWFGEVPLPLWDWTIALLFLALTGDASGMLMRFYVAWQRMRRLLRSLSATPLVHAFDRLPRQLANTFGMRLSRAPQRLSDLRFSIDQLRLMAAPVETPTKSAHTPPPTFAALVDGLIPDPTAIIDAFAREEARWARGPWPAYAHDSKTQRMLARQAGTTWRQLEHVWAGDLLRRQAGEAIGPGRAAERSDCDSLERTTTRLHDHADLRLRLAEEFVATELARYFGYVFTHLKSLLASSMLAMVLMLLAVASYPFQPQQLLMRCVIGGILVLVGVFLVVLVQIERDEILSRTADRTPNRVNFDATFGAQVVTFAGLPLITLLVTQFPAFDRFFASMLHTLRGY